jgi:flagellar hook-length control protein FliK
MKTRTNASPTCRGPAPSPPGPGCSTVDLDRWGTFSAVLRGEEAPGEEGEGLGPAPDPRREKGERRTEEDVPGRTGADARVEPPGASAQPQAEARPATVPAAPRPQPQVIAPPLQVIADQMLRCVSVHQLRGQTDLHLELSTPRLPRVGLEMRIEAGRFTARFRVPDAAGRELLRTATPELETSLGQLGIRVEAIRVELDDEAPPARRSAGEKGQDDGGRRRRERRPGRERDLVL